MLWNNTAVVKTVTTDDMGDTTEQTFISSYPVRFYGPGGSIRHKTDPHVESEVIDYNCMGPVVDSSVHTFSTRDRFVIEGTTYRVNRYQSYRGVVGPNHFRFRLELEAK